MADRPRKLLSLDGGGIRGIVTLHVLRRMEQLLRESTGRGPDFRLCEYFDYIGGTSTGAIIAAGLARGMSVDELMNFYRTIGSRMWRHEWSFRRLRHAYSKRVLVSQLRETFGADTTLAPTDLRCLLLVVTRNHLTDSPWPISSNPLAMFNDPGLPDCNLNLPLWQLVRASTAAPTYFEPERVALDPAQRDRQVVFVDGGTTPYANPAFLLYRMATSAGYRLGWRTGERDLLLVSIGTGSAAFLGDGRERNQAKTGVHNFKSLMRSTIVDQDVACRHVGRCTYGPPIDLEIGDLVPRDAAGAQVPFAVDQGRSFTYVRYDVDLEEATRALQLGKTTLQDLRTLDAFRCLPQLEQVGAHGATQVSLDHFASFAAS